MHAERQPERSGRRELVAAAAVYVLTTLQLAIATFVPGLPQFEGKAFGARLLAYPLLMAAPPAVWWLAARRPPLRELPWGAFALVMSPFLVDATGNTLDLYDRVFWWDDLNHFVNWLLLCWGCGLLLVRGRVTPTWALGLAIAGLGALLAIGWEIAEWYTFIRGGTELETAYEDTLGDEMLGALGGIVASLIVVRTTRGARRPIADPAAVGP
ncbi:MAG: hypothetical protein M5U27_08730 [Gaiella sp.]|nr:hypothetical protein [Gaiella sp.]